MDTFFFGSVYIESIGSLQFVPITIALMPNSLYGLVGIFALNTLAMQDGKHESFETVKY